MKLILALLMAGQMIFNVVIYNTVANRPSHLKISSVTPEYPGYYCGQHNCSLLPLGIPLNGN